MIRLAPTLFSLSLLNLFGQGEPSLELTQPTYPFSGNFPFLEEVDATEAFPHGIVEFMGQRTLSGSFINPSITGQILVYENDGGTPSEAASLLFSKSGNSYISEVGEKAIIRFSFTSAQASPTRYQLRAADDQESDFPRNWQFEGSLDGEKWQTLSQVSDDTQLNSPGDSATFAVEVTGTSYRHFRLVMTGENSSSNLRWHLGGIELYGELQYSPPQLPDFDKFAALEFEMSSSEDGEPTGEQGIFGFLTNPTEKVSLNPIATGELSIQLSSSDLESAQAWELFANEAALLRTDNTADQSIIMTLNRSYLEPLGYEISRDAESGELPMTSWKLEASNDQHQWVTLQDVTESTPREVTKDGARFEIVRAAEWPPFKHFRLRNSDPELSAAIQLAGIDFYGTYYAAPDVIRPTEDSAPCTPVELPLDEEGGNDGLIGYLATPDGTSEYQNPVLSGSMAISSSGVDESYGPRSGLTSETPQNFATLASPTATLEFRLLEGLISPSHYKIRHLSNSSDNALRNWEIQASRGGDSWITLRKHISDSNLNAAGSEATWAIPSPIDGAFYDRLRLVLTGVNSSGNQLIALSDIEFFGTYCPSAAPVTPPTETQQFDFETDFGESGILYQLGTSGETRDYQNPALYQFVEVSASSTLADSKPVTAILDRESIRFATQPVKNSWVLIDFKSRRLIPNRYALRHYSSWDTEALRNWVIEASNNLQNWTTLRRHIDDRTLNRKGSTGSWPLSEFPSPATGYRYFRIRQDGRNSNLHYYLALSGIEFYGTLFSEDEIIEPVPEDGRSFNYDSDFDGNGVVNYLGTNDFTSNFANPTTTGLMEVTASSLMQDSQPASATLGQQAVRCVTRPEPNSSFTFEFKTLSIAPTHYTLQHYSSWDTEALRNWVFEASIDGNHWEILRTHQNDDSLQAKGQSHTWSIPDRPETIYYSYFRVRQTGLNSSLHHYLALTGFEIYGRALTRDDYLIPSDPLPPSNGFTISSGGTPGSPGLFHFLGTDNGNRPFENPANSGTIKVTASSVLPNSEAPESLLNQGTDRFVTKPERNAFVQFDLGALSFIPSSYALRHYSSYDSETLRNWHLEGSNDEESWTVLSTHINDTSLNRKNQWAEFQISPNNQPFRYLRIIQVGRNSNLHLNLALGEVEFYGQLENGLMPALPSFNQWAVNQGVSLSDIVPEKANPSLPSRTLFSQFAFGDSYRKPSKADLASFQITNTDDQRYLNLTYLIRNSASLESTSPFVLSDDDIRYRAIGASSLSSPGSLEVELVDPPLLPPNAPPPAEGYRYQTIRLAEPIGTQDQAFLKLGASPAP